MTASASLAISLSGAFQATLRGAPLEAIESSKGRALLAYLAVEADRPHSRLRLATLLWSEETEAASRQNLRQLLYNLRQALPAPPDAEPFLLVDAQTVQFNPASDHWLDVRAFLDLIETCEQHRHRRLDACRDCLERLRQAASLYRGDFLAGFSLPDSDEFEGWLMARREELRTHALTVLTTLAVHHEYRREYEQAGRHLQRAIEIAPWHEESHRDLIRILALRGQTAAALRQYDILRSQLAAELAIPPSAETEALLKRVRTGQVQPESHDLTNPYKGLHAFGEEDADDFFGRETYTQQLLDLVRSQPAVIVVGASGCGKSSVIFAGLLPRLRSLSLAPEGSQTEPWKVTSFRPGGHPFDALAEALAPLAAPQSAGALAVMLRNGAFSLPATQQPLLVVVDQAEELFTLCTDAETRKSFLDLLITPQAGRVVLLAMRGDFIGQALAHRSLTDAMQQGGLVLGPMNGEELQQAIEEPARERGVTFEAGLVERLRDDVRDEPGNLPLLQFALTLLWEQRRNGSLTHVAYEAIGGVAGALTAYAEQVFTGLDATDQTRARSLFLRLVQPGENTPPTRRLLVRQNLDTADWPLVQHLADARLVVTDRSGAGIDTVEIAHEALIREWPRLRDWLADDAEFHSWHTRLLAALRQWQTSDYDDSALLQGVLLNEADVWLQQRRTDLTDPEKTFIAASIARKDRERRESELRYQRELAQAQAVALSERRRAETEAKSIRRLRFLAAVLAISLLFGVTAALIAVQRARSERQQANVALIARKNAETEKKRAEEQAALAETERQRAEEQSRRALSRQIGAQAITMLPQQLDLALLLAVESARLAVAEDKAQLLLNLNFSPLIAKFFHGETTAVDLVAFRANDPNYFVTSAEGSVRVWDIASGQAVAQPVRSDAGALAALSPDGRWAVTIDGSQYTLWDIGKSQPLGTPFTEHQGEIDYLAFSADGNRLIVGSRDGALILRDVTSGKVLERLTYDGSGGMALSPDGKILAMFDDFPQGSGIELWDLNDGHRLAGPFFGHEGTVHSITYSPDGSLLATAGFDKTARLWDGKTGQPVGKPLIGHSGRVLAAAFSADGRTLATGSTDDTILLWDIATAQPLGPPLTGHSNWVRGLAFSRDGRWLVSTDAGGGIALWDMSTRRILHGHQEHVRGVAVSPDGRVLMTTSFDKTLRFWDAISGEALASVATPHKRSIIQTALSPDGKVLAMGDVGGVITLWDAATRQLLHPPIQARESIVIGLTFSPDGSLLAAGDFDGVITLWDVASARPLSSSPPLPDNWVLALAFSPDGNLLASGAVDGKIRFWDATPAHLHADASLHALSEPLSGHTNWITSLAFTADGNMLASGSSDRSVRFWDVAKRQSLEQPLLGHDKQVWGVRFYPPDDRTLASLAGDGSVILWDVASRQPLGPPVHATTETEAMTLSPDGRRFYLGGIDSTVHIWTLDPLPWPERACAIANRNLTPAEWQEYFRDEPYHKTCPALP